MPADHHPQPCVLVVEEERAIRDLLQQGLQARGFRVVLAGSGREALEHYQRVGGEIVVALIDVGMSGMDGPAVLAALRKLAPDLPCCLMTGGQAGMGMKANDAVRVFAKPFSLDEIASALYRIVRGSEPEEPRGASQEREP